MDKIRFCTCDKTNNYILCITEKNQAYIFNIKKENYVKYDPYDPKIEVKLGYLHGGFFICNRKNEKRKEEEIDIALIGNNSYRIITILISGKNASTKNTFASQKTPITEYFYDNKFNALILRNEYLGFYFVNLKNTYCYNSCIELKINDVFFTSKFFIQNIYNKLYFVHFTENLIEFYRLKNLKEKKDPKVIKFNRSEKTIDYELTQVQFYNNLLILYIGDNIRLYDIKSDFNKKMGKIIIPEEKRDGFFDKIKIRGKFVIINNDIYKIKFLPENYKKNNISNPMATFFNLLRRNHCSNLVTSILIKLLHEYELSTFYAIFNRIIENQIKVRNKTFTEDKKNINEIMYIGHSLFYLEQEDIFSIFNNDFGELGIMKLLQLMATIYNEYSKNNIEIDTEVFIPALLNQLNKTDDFSCLEFIIRNKNILINKKLGLYLIDRSKTMNEIKYKNLAFNLGIEMLSEDEENPDSILFVLNEEGKIDDMVNIIIDFYIGYKFDKKDKNLRKDLNVHLKKFITSKLTSGSKGNINYNNFNNRYLSMVGEDLDF
jgi:predicted nucleotidyltransferase